MGVDIRNSLLVGASYGELEEWFDGKVEENEHEYEDFGIQDVIEEYFEYASPYYDSSVEDQFFGFKIPNYHEMNEEWWQVVKEAAHQFELLTGVKARIRGGAHVY